MSREIDPNNMSDEDKVYLAQRGQLDPFKVSVADQRKMLDPEQIALADRANTGDVNTVNISKEEYENLLKLRAAYEQEGTNPLELMEQTGEAAASADEEEDDDSPYAEMSKADMVNEIQERNERRVAEGKEELPIGGKKAELRALLEQDDEED